MNDQSHKIVELFKNKAFVIMLAITIFVIFGFVAYLIYTDRHFKVGDTEVFSKDSNITRSISRDTNARPQPNIQAPIISAATKNLGDNVTTRVKQKNKSGDNIAVGKDNNGVISRDAKDVHIVNGPNNGINGDVYTGIKQRHVTNELISFIIKQIPDRSITLTIQFENNQETHNYANEIYHRLQDSGYNKYQFNGIMISPPEPRAFQGVYIPNNAGVYANVQIFASPNVQQ